MSINSQFLYSYTDQFTKSQWVYWSEGALSRIPAQKYQNKHGFQHAINSSDSTDRTRAGEAYRLGFLKGPIIDSRFETSHPLPLGWALVIKGLFPHSTLGMYAYLIGRAMQIDEQDVSFKSALDALATIQILHIGFKEKGKWYCTVVFYEFARNELNKILKRELNSGELRYLAGAVINTLNEGGFDYFYNAVVGNLKLDRLFFLLRNGRKHSFLLSEFEELVSKNIIDINDIRNHKAALFWSSIPRGLYSRASASDGRNFLNTFFEFEASKYRKDHGSSLSEIFESISRGEYVKDIFELANDAFAPIDNVNEKWERLVVRLNNATRLCVEKADFSAVPDLWKYSLRHIFGRPDTDIPLPETEPSIELKQAKAKTTIPIPTSEDIKVLLNTDRNLFCDIPSIEQSYTKETLKTKKKVSNIDYVEKSKRNTAIGKSGEEFVYELEVKKLKEAGKNDLSKKVLWVSHEIGDGIGYDILSFDENEKHLFIEVKTTRKGPNSPFYLSTNELEVSIEKGTDYKIYRLFNYPVNPNIYVVTGPLPENLDLVPINYIALPINKIANR